MPGQKQAEEDDTVWRSMILDMELQLCDKMLRSDERNFHCWNYRLWVIDTYEATIGKRVEGSLVRHF